jgi:uncharacterized coiled-coil protein SlyX
MAEADRPPEWAIDIDVKLAYQERLIGDLDALVRVFAGRLDDMQRELNQLKQTVVSPATPLGGANEPPPHY